MSMTRTGIEYARGDDGKQGYAWNFYPGCQHKSQGICPLDHCWAEGMSKRQQADFHQPHLIPERLLAPLSVKKPSRILVNFMGDLGGSWVDPEKPIGTEVEAWRKSEHYGWIAKPDCTLRHAVFEVINACPQHTFIFLTKNPSGWLKWGRFPDNCLVGATYCGGGLGLENKALGWTGMYAAFREMWLEKDAKNLFLSFEPLLKPVPQSVLDSLYMFKWVIIGAQTRPDVQPETAWVKDIIRAADSFNIPVYLKDNLRLPTDPLFRPLDTPDWATSWELRQEMPALGNHPRR